jgi:hypothetical protein
MRNLEQWLRRPNILTQLTLGAYGNLLEMTIHNWMHMRWASVPRDPASGKVESRGNYDVDTRWDDPKNDYLGEFHTSHVNPVFWKLHGWVDDRVEDWFRAHDAARPGAIRRTTLRGVSHGSRRTTLGFSRVIHLIGPNRVLTTAAIAGDMAPIPTRKRSKSC